MTLSPDIAAAIREVTQERRTSRRGTDPQLLGRLLAILVEDELAASADVASLAALLDLPVGAPDVPSLVAA